MEELGNNSSIPSFARGLSILLVDSDTNSLLYLSSMLQQYAYQVTATKESSVALSMLKKQKDRFKLVMVDINTIAFLHELKENNVPIILMSSERSIRFGMKRIAEGASFYLQKPICIDDLKYIWQLAFRKRRIASTPHSQDTQNQTSNASTDAEQQEEKEKEKENSNGNNKIGTQKPQENNTNSNSSSNEKKSRILWTPELHLKFTAAISELGDKKARPKPILEIMNVPHLTQRQVASHLQKYKSQVQRICETGTTILPAVSKSSNSYGIRTSILGELDNITSFNFGFRVMTNGATQELDSVVGRSIAAPSIRKETNNELKFAAHGNPKLDLMQLSNTHEMATDYLPSSNLDDWKQELDLMSILHSNSGEGPNLDEILNMEVSGGAINQSQPIIDYADELMNMVEEEPLAAQPNPVDVDRYCQWLIS